MAVKLFGKTIVGGEAQRKEAAANEFSGKYPLTNDCGTLQSTIDAAKAELANINASRPSTAGGKRIKKRNADALGAWLNEMQNYLKDLTCGIVGSAVQGQPTTITPTPPVAPVVFTKEVIKQYVAPTPPQPSAPSPTLPSGESATTSPNELNVAPPKVQTQVIEPTQPITPTPQVAMGSGLATPMLPQAKDNTQQYLLYGAIGLVALLLITKE